MRNRTSILTLLLVCGVTFVNTDANAQRGRTHSGKRARFNATAKMNKPQKASDYKNSVGADTSTATVASQENCGAGTYFTGSTCVLCGTGTWSTAGSSTCVSCGDGVATCNSTNGDAITCNSGYKIEGTKCVVDNSNGSNGGSTTPDSERFKELVQKYSLQLTEVSASCGGIASALEKVSGLNTASTISSGIGTLAAGTATVTSLVKASKDNKVMDEDKSNLDAEFDEFRKQTCAGFGSDLENGVCVKKDGKNNLWAENITTTAVEDFAQDAEKLIKKLSLASKKDFEKSLRPDVKLLASKINELTQEKARSGIDAAQKTEIEKKIAELTEQKKAVLEGRVKYSDELKTNTQKLYKEMLEIDSKEKYEKAKRLESSTKGLGYATTGLMAGATLTSGISAGTSFAATATASDVIDRINECNERVRDLRIIASELSTIKPETEEMQKAQKISIHATKVVNACDISENKIQIVKNLTLASGIVSTVGTATGLAGTITAGVSNKDNISNSTRKGTNTATSVLAGVTTGTSAASTTTGIIAKTKISDVIDDAKKCEDVLRENLVDITTKTGLDNIRYSDGTEAVLPGNTTGTDTTTTTTNK